MLKGAVWGGEGAARRVNEGEGRPDVEAIRVYEDSELKKPAPKALQQVTAKDAAKRGKAPRRRGAPSSLVLTCPHLQSLIEEQSVRSGPMATLPGSTSATVVRSGLNI